MWFSRAKQRSGSATTSHAAARVPGIARYHHWLPDRSQPTKPTVHPSAMAKARRTARRTENSASISRMLRCQAFVAALVVSGESGHQLLGVCTAPIGCLSQEVLGLMPPQGCGNAPVMEDLYIPILATAQAEPKVGWVGRRFRLHACAGVLFAASRWCSAGVGLDRAASVFNPLPDRAIFCVLNQACIAEAQLAQDRS